LFLAFGLNLVLVSKKNNNDQKYFVGYNKNINFCLTLKNT